MWRSGAYGLRWLGRGGTDEIEFLWHGIADVY